MAILEYLPKDSTKRAALVAAAVASGVAGYYVYSSIKAAEERTRQEYLEEQESLRNEQLVLKEIAARSFYKMTAKDIYKKPFDFSTLEDKAVMIINVASKWGRTDAIYQEMAELAEKYEERGLVVMAFPCDSFGGQELATNEEIVEFVTSKYSDKFILMDKIDVNGPFAHPLYTWLKVKSDDLDDIKWNFDSTFLVSKDGEDVSRMSANMDVWKDMIPGFLTFGVPQNT